MKKILSIIAIVIVAVLFLFSAVLALNTPTYYSPTGVIPKNYKKLPLNKIILGWPEMKNAKSYFVAIQDVDWDNNPSNLLLIITNKNKINVQIDDFESAVIFKQDMKGPFPRSNKKEIAGFFKKGHKYNWGVAGLDSKIIPQTEYTQEEIEDLSRTVQKNSIGELKKQGRTFFTEPKSFLGTVSTPVSDELLKELPKTVTDQLKSGEGNMIINFSALDQSPIIKNSPAEKAGLQAGDVILEIDGKQINKDFRVTDSVDLKNPGNVINVKIWRAEGTEEKIVSKIIYKKIKLTKRPYKLKSP